ncbi:MAG: hypothetical protein ABIR33_03745 [Pyrinomonadaceae bacterium]
MLTDFPKLHFTNGPFNEYEWEVKLKGWFSGVTVELEGSAFYAVHFYDPVRLSQELQAQLEGIAKGWNSDPYIADVAMIVVPEITESNIRLAVQRLFDANWFDRFVPLSSLEA